MANRDSVATVVFVQPHGQRETVTDVVGQSIMDFAVDHGVEGILAQCGGACICTTCHCYFDNHWWAKLAEPETDENEMLEYTPDRRATSRLACQVPVTKELDGIEVYILGQDRKE